MGAVDFVWEMLCLTYGECKKEVDMFEDAKLRQIDGTNERNSTASQL